MAQAAVRSKVVVLLLLIYFFIYLPLFVGFLCLSLFWYGLLCVLSSFAIVLTRKREMVALLLWLFLTMPLVSLQCVIVVFPDHTHLLYLAYIINVFKLLCT